MDWKREAIEKLRNHEACRQSLRGIPAAIKLAEDRFVAIRSATTDGTPVAGGGNAREDAILNNIALREELRAALDQAQRMFDLVEQGLAVLSPEERLVLDRFYIKPMSSCVDCLCMELKIEQASVYRRRDRALRHFTRAMYGVTES